MLHKGDVEGCSFDNTDPIIGDGLELPVTWNGDANINHGGEPIIFQFQLRQAKLFGLEFY
jgi:hypothetical protein